MEVSNEIIENVIIDFSKKDIPKEEKAELIKRYMKENNLSERKLSAITGIPRATINDWKNPETRDNRYSNEEKKLGCLLSSLKNISSPDLKLENVLYKIEIELNRLKDLITRKKIHK